MLPGWALPSLPQRRGVSSPSRAASAGYSVSFPLPPVVLGLHETCTSPEAGLSTQLAQLVKALCQLEQAVPGPRGCPWPLTQCVWPKGVLGGWQDSSYSLGGHCCSPNAPPGIPAQLPCCIAAPQEHLVAMLTAQVPGGDTSNLASPAPAAMMPPQAEPAACSALPWGWAKPCMAPVLQVGGGRTQYTQQSPPH